MTMADLKLTVNEKMLALRIKEILLEWNPTLINDPQKLDNIAMAIQQDFFALAQQTPELLTKSVSELDPLMKYLTAKQLELHSGLSLKPDPIRALQKKCDELIKEICKDDPDLEKELKKTAKEAAGQASEPGKTGLGMNMLNNLYTVLNQAKQNNNPKVLFEFLSDKDKANISYSGQLESGTHKTTLTKIVPNPVVLTAINDATKEAPVAATKIDHTETNYKTPTPFDISGPKKDK